MRAVTYYEFPVGVVASIARNEMAGASSFFFFLKWLARVRSLAAALHLFGIFFSALYMGRPSRGTPVREADCLPHRAAHRNSRHAPWEEGVFIFWLQGRTLLEAH